MKRLLLLSVFLVLITGCKDKFIYRNDLPEPYFRDFSLTAHKYNDKYYICDGFDSKINKYYVFSLDRYLIESTEVPSFVFSGSQLDLRCYLGKKVNEIEGFFGAPHFELGSGLYKPAYLTRDAYLITFVFWNGEVDMAVKVDLLTGETIEFYKT